MSNLGTDFAAVDDIDAQLTFHGPGREVRAYLEAIARRVLDDEIWYVPGEYGFDLLKRIGSGFADIRTIGAKIELTALRDPRTYRASFDGAFVGDELTGTLSCETYSGTFELTVSASDARGVLVGGV